MTRAHEESTNNPVIIQDIVVVATKPHEKGRIPTGEFGMEEVDETTQLKRLFSTIEDLVTSASQHHIDYNFNTNNTITPGKENNITRLVTNEFLFYTKKPLSLDEFSHFQQQISDLAEKNPANLHLVLSSFAVLTPDDTIMDVVTFVECGKPAKMNFIVKNTVSDNDPVYSLSHDRERKNLKNVSADSDNLDSYFVVINGSKHTFSYNNVVNCMTAGGQSIPTGVDICLDHKSAIAMKNASQLQPKQFSHIVTSNYIDLKSKYSLGTVTHADPLLSIIDCKQGADKATPVTLHPTFGMPLTYIETSPVPCHELRTPIAITVNTAPRSTSKAHSLDMFDDIDDDDEEDKLKDLLNDGMARAIKAYSSTENDSARSKYCTWMSKQAQTDPGNVINNKDYLSASLKQLQAEFKKLMRGSAPLSEKSEKARELLKTTLQAMEAKEAGLCQSKAYVVCERKLQRLDKHFPSHEVHHSKRHS